MQKMISAVKKGDKIVTIGGIHGTIHAVKDTSVVVRVDEDCRIEFSKSAIASVSVVKTDEKPAEVTAEKAEKPAEKAEEKK